MKSCGLEYYKSQAETRLGDISHALQTYAQKKVFQVWFVIIVGGGVFGKFFR